MTSMDEQLMAVLKAHSDLKSSLHARRRARDLRRSREPLSIVYTPGMPHPLDREAIWHNQDVAAAKAAILEAILEGHAQATLLLNYAEARATLHPRETQIALAELVADGVLLYADHPVSTLLAPGPKFPASKEAPSL